VGEGGSYCVEAAVFAMQRGTNCEAELGRSAARKKGVEVASLGMLADVEFLVRRSRRSPEFAESRCAGSKFVLLVKLRFGVEPTPDLFWLGGQLAALMTAARQQTPKQVATTLTAPHRLSDSPMKLVLKHYSYGNTEFSTPISWLIMSFWGRSWSQIGSSTRGLGF